MSQDLQDVKRQVLRVWREMAPGWERQEEFMEKSIGSITDWMIQKLDPQPGQTILDLAAGPGDLGFLIAGSISPGGKLISSDYAPEMVEVARRAAARMGLENVEFRVLDAEKNDLPANSLDGVLCRWGYMLMTDPDAALAETRRVLRPGGRLVFSVMAGPGHNPWASLVVKALVGLSLAPSQKPDTPGGLFSLADHGRIRDLVTGAGFGDLEMQDVDFRFSFSNFHDFWRFLTEFAGAVSHLLNRLDEDEVLEAKGEIYKTIGPYRQGEGFDFPGKSVNVLAF